MKVAQLIRPAAGGMRRHFVLLAKKLSGSYQITAYIPGDDFLVQELSSAGIAFKVIPFPARGKIQDYYRLSSLLAEEWKGGDFSLFHFHGYRAALVGSLALRKLKKGLGVATIHSFPPYGLKNRVFFWLSRKIISSSCQALIFVSQAVKDSWKIRENKKAIVIYNGVSEEFFRPVGLIPSPESLKKERFKVAFLGRLSREKGADVFLKAAHVLKDEPKLRFLVAGEGEEKRNLVELSIELGLEDKVEFLDFQPDLKSFLNNLDIVVVPSRQEAFSLLAIEALASGKPVIASKVGGLPEALGEYGYFFQPGDFEELAQKIKETVDNLSAFPAKEACRWVQKNFPLSKMVKQVEEVYRNVVEADAKKIR